MGEKVEETKKSEGEKKDTEAVVVSAAAAPSGGDNAGKKDDNTPIPIVLKLDLHCDGCAKKVKRAIRQYEGVHDVKADASSNEVTVKGNVDPSCLRDQVATNTKKKVDLLSPPHPKKEGGASAGGGDNKPVDLKAEKKQEEKKPDHNNHKESAAILKILLHCDGCAHKIKRIISRFNGVEHVSMDQQNNLVTVKGTMDVKELTHYLQRKLKRPVEIVQSKKEDGGEKKKKEGGGGDNNEGGDGDKKEGGGGDNKDKEGGGGGDGGDKKGGGGGGGGGVEAKKEAPKVEANKYEYEGHNPSTYYTSAPMYNHQSYYNQDYYGMSMFHNQTHPTTAHMVQYPHMPVVPSYVNAPQMFSDENPNACIVM